jgi:alpha-L-rhamnosidase
MKQFLLSIAAILVAATAVGGAEPIALRCEYHANPIGIDTAQPRLSWKLESDQRAQMQTAYRILVASSQEALAKDVGDLWDSEKVELDQSIQVVYQGKPLVSCQQYHWKVMVWDQDNKPSAWSAPAIWLMGLLNPSDWKANWIGYDQVPANPVAENSEIVFLKALYGAEGTPAKQVDISDALRGAPSSSLEGFVINNDLAGKDPAPGMAKTLQLEYTLDGVLRKRVLDENTTFNFHNTNRENLLKRRYLPSPHLRKEFQVKSPVKRAVVYASAEGVYEMHLNGQRISDEFYQPGWTDYRKRIYYRAYDVTDLLQEGTNAVGGILGDGWFRGNISILGQNKYGTTLRLLTQLNIDYQDGSTDTIASDESWKASFGPILKSDMQAGETYDARLAMPGWDRLDYDDSGWAPVTTGSKLKPLLQAYPGTPVRPTEEIATVSVTEPQPEIFVFDMGQNFSGWVRLKANGQAGDKVMMRFGEMLNPDGTVFTDNLRSARATDMYVLSGEGEETWEPHFTFHGFRYVEVTGLAETPAPEMLTGILVHTDAPMTSSFECSDPMLNQLHRNILWGQRSNYLEVPTDCPQRDERLGWTGDTQVYIRSGTYHQDVSAFFTKWMVDLMDTANARGLLGKQAPVFHGRGSPGWADAGIICPWTIYRVYGDTRIIEEHYAAMTRYLEACGKKGLDGLGDGFGDWLAVGSKTPKEVISVAYYAYVTKLMAEMSEAVGKDADAEKYRALFERIAKHFQERFVKADGKIQGHTQTGYCMALHFGLLNDKQRKQAVDHLVDRIEAKDFHLSVGFLGVPILLPTLTEIGRSDLAYRLLQNKTYPSWGYSVEQGATTIWERWNSWTREKGFNAGAMNSFNHYAYGACSEWMFYSILGIDLNSPGYKSIRMKPEVGHGVQWAKGHYDSIHGRITSDWKIDVDKFRWKVTVPANTTASLFMPTDQLGRVTESGRPIEDIVGLRFDDVKDGRVVLAVGSGTYDFMVKRN